jgi:hypothetical protein
MASGRSPSLPSLALGLTYTVNIIVHGEIQRSTRSTWYVLRRSTRFSGLIWRPPIGCSSSSPTFWILEASSFPYKISFSSILQDLGHSVRTPASGYSTLSDDPLFPRPSATSSNLITLEFSIARLPHFSVSQPIPGRKFGPAISFILIPSPPKLSTSNGGGALNICPLEIRPQSGPDAF